MNCRLFIGQSVAAAAMLGLTLAEPAQAFFLRPDLWTTLNTKITSGEGFFNDPELTRINPQALFWDGTGPVDVFFINVEADYRNQLFYSANGEPKTLLFNDIASPLSLSPKPDGALTPGEGRSLGRFSGPTQLDFFLRADGYRNPNGYLYGANPANNPDGLEHLLAFAYFDSVEAQTYILLAFEDLFGTQAQGSDRDFNDGVFAVRGLRPGATAQTPEPAAILSLIAVSAAALSRRRPSQ